MKKLKFVEIIGKASTSAWRSGRLLGHNCNACAYEDGKGRVVVKLESNSSPVRAVKPVVFDGDDAYESWKESCPDGISMLLHGLRLFSCETSFDVNY